MNIKKMIARVLNNSNNSKINWKKCCGTRELLLEKSQNA